jgi:hypothetical protein
VAGARAQILAVSGHGEAADAVGRAGVAVTDFTDLLTDRGMSLLALATALRTAGRRTDARAVLEELADVLGRKGALAGEAHARRLIAEL